jgi:hypothetical protein
MLARVTTGIPIEPKATGAVLASKQTGEHRRGHGDWRAESGGAFDERAEGERDQERLQAAVLRESADRVFDDFKLAALDRDTVKEDRRVDNPANGEQSGGGAVKCRRDREADRHPIKEESDGDRSGQPGERGNPSGLALNAEKEQQDEDRKGSDEC